MQAQKDAFNRRHNDHQHSMTLSTPRGDIRQMMIPNDTIQPLGKRTVRMPFHYLRTWIFSLLALVCLPLGIGLGLVGAGMTENLDEDWQEYTATVLRNNDDGVTYRLADDDISPDQGRFGYELDDFVDMNVAGELVWSISVCDLLSRVIIPKEDRTEFPIWVNANNPEQQSCVPITQDFATLYLVLGFILAALSALHLLRTINAAALKRA